MKALDWIDKKPEVRVMTDVEKAWFSAALDGEGSIGLYSGADGRTVHIQIFNTVEEFVQRAKEIVGCGSIHKRNNSIGRRGTKPVFSYHVRGMCRCYTILKQIEPFLIIKKEKAQRILLELEQRPFGRWTAATKEAKLKQSERMKLWWQERKQPSLRA